MDVLALGIAGSALLLAIAVVILSAAVGLYANRIATRIAEKRIRRRSEKLQRTHGQTDAQRRRSDPPTPS